MRTRNLQLAAGLLAASLHLSAAATAITAGTAESVTARTCTFPGPSGCAGFTPVQEVAYGGAPGAYSSAASINVPGKGLAEGEVTLSGVIGAPLLKARAQAHAGYRLNTNSLALQRYTYTGEGSTRRTFGGTLTYEQDVTGPYPQGIGSGVFARMDIFRIDADTIDVGTSAVDNFFALFGLLTSLGANQATNGYASLGSVSYEDVTDTTSGLGTLSLSVDLDPGDTIWVWVLLQTPAANGGVIDASHTLVTNWDSTADLTPGAVAATVPLPGSLSLFGLAALAGFAARRRG